MLPHPAADCPDGLLPGTNVLPTPTSFRPVVTIRGEVHVRPNDPSRLLRRRSDALRTVVVAKPGGGIRTLTVLGSRDLRRYEAVVAAVVPSVERALGRVAAANRAQLVATGLRLEAWPSARRRYRRAVASAAAGPFRAAFVGDVRDCYGSITLAEVARALHLIGVHEARVEPVVETLRWFEELGVRGLPVGPAPSAVLANAVLAPVDRALTGAVDGPVLRWVDDVVAFATDRQSAGRAAAAFERALDDLGLTPHPGKCMTLRDPGAVRASAGGSHSGPQGCDVA